MIFKTDAVVLRKDKISDSDVILTLFTRKCGKIRAVAKGARKPKTKLSAASHPFVYGEFIFNKGKNLDQISSIDIKESFYRIREDLEKLSYGSYFVELCDAVIVEGVTNNRLFNLLINGLNLITYQQNIDLDLLKVAFEIKLLNFSGLRPELRRCVNCSQDSNIIAFNPELGGVLCEKCNKEAQGSFIINDTILKIIEYILLKDLLVISKLKINSRAIHIIDRIFERYLYFHLENRKFKSLDFLRSIRKI